MLLKSLEFKRNDGQKVKIIEIPVLPKHNQYYFMLEIRLQTFLTSIYQRESQKSVYSFREYLKKVLKWPDYDAIFQTAILKNNA
ncbi:DUF2535 family protein [Bacillus lacus]|uniref:DUF2535 family protein n=1 Tax=Metabacillus lacus TaxID=1983721 RepID=A0A7X2LVY9_9BACI|nr:DUF2535 family protein [Metabacillus lacus]MRX70895.1 DUF2535 family protein [Metabacillus lacus]